MSSIYIGPPILKMPLGPLRDFTEKKNDHQKSWKSCPICPRKREGRFFFLFFLCSSLSSSAYVIYKFLVIMLHEVTLSWNELHIFSQPVFLSRFWRPLKTSAIAINIIILIHHRAHIFFFHLTSFFTFRV